MKLVLGWRHRKLGFELYVACRLDPCKQDGLCSWQHDVPYNKHILEFFFLCLDSFYGNGIHQTQHISVFWHSLVQFGALCPKPWYFKKHCWIEGVVLNSLTLKIMPVFWHTNPPEMSGSACFILSHLILIKSRSLPDLWISLFEPRRG